VSMKKLILIRHSLSQIDDLFNNPNRKIFGDETTNQAKERFKLAVKKVVNQYPDKTIAIVTHRTVMSLFTSKLVDG